MPAERQEYAKKYSDLFVLEQLLVRKIYAKYLFNINIKIDKSYLHGLEKLNNDESAISSLSTYAVNILMLSRSVLRCKNLKKVEELLILGTKIREPNRRIYFYTHMIIASSNFYTKSISLAMMKTYRKMLDKLEQYIVLHYDNIFLDPKLEFLLVAKMVGYQSKIYSKIIKQVESNIAIDGHVYDPKKGGGIDEAEHRSMLYLGVMKWDIPWLC